jgi:hypothetical protein
MPVAEDEFETMLARARSFRARLDELGIAGGAVEDFVYARLRHRPYGELPPAPREFAEEILALLKSPELSTWQALELEQAFASG